MSDKVEKLLLEDGRRAERRVMESLDDCHGQKVVEHWEEEARPLFLKQRVIEKTEPVVTERTVEKIDGNDVVERQVFSLLPSTNLQLKEHIALANPEPPVAQEDGAVTRDELHSHMTNLVEGLKEVLAQRTDTAEENYAVAARPMRAAVEQEIQSNGQQWGLWDWLIVGVIMIELVYVVTNIVPQYLN